MAFWQLWRTVAEQKTLQQQLLANREFHSSSKKFVWHSDSLLDVPDHVTRWEALPLTGDVVETEDGPTIGTDAVIEEEEKKEDSIKKNPIKVRVCMYTHCVCVCVVKLFLHSLSQSRAPNLTIAD